MPITLVIRSGAEALPEQARTKTFEPGRWTIGREEGSDWCLPHPTVSRRHCLIADEHGRATLTDISSHGVFADGSSNRIPKGETIPLRNGQRLTIGAFDIEVRLATQPLPLDADADHTQTGGSDWQRIPPGQHRRRSSFEDVPKGHAASEREPDAFEAWQRAEELKPPRPNDERAQAIHAHWAPPAVSPPASGSPPPDSEALLPSRSSKELPLNLADLLAGKAEGRNAEPAAYSVSPPMPTLQLDDREDAEDAQRSRAADPAASDLPTPPAKPAAPALPASRNSERAALAAFFEGARLDHQIAASGDPERILRQAGAMVRTVVEGIMRLLEARGQVKGEFGLNRTVFQPELNNPLKFSGDVDHALDLLFASDRKHYQAPDAAVSEAISDVIQHQLQLIESFQRAWQDLLHSLDPQGLEQRVGVDRGIAKVFGVQKARCWDIYKERYREVLVESERIFRQEMAVGYQSRDKETP